jgi:hypothetical protein
MQAILSFLRVCVYVCVLETTLWIEVVCERGKERHGRGETSDDVFSPLHTVIHLLLSFLWSPHDSGGSLCTAILFVL